MAKRVWRRLGIGLISLVLLLSGSGLALWSGSGIALSQQANQYKAHFQLTELPKEGRIGLRLVLSNVTITNTGTLSWPKNGSSPIKLAYRWFYNYGAPVPKTGKDAWDDLRADLPQDIAPGITVIFPQFIVGVPSTPGDYTLHLNLAQDQSFFSDKGSPDYEIKLTIKPRDTTAPTATISFLPLYTTLTTFPVSWLGKDDPDGTGVATYDLQYKISGEGDWHDWLLNTSLTSASFTGENGKLYFFRVRASDRAGNTGNYTLNEQAATRLDALSPVSKINTLPTQSASTFLVRWSSFDNVDLAGPELYDVQFREGSNGAWVDWINATASQAAAFRGEPGKIYSFRVRAIDYAGNQEDYSAEAQASTTTSPALDSLYAAPILTATTNTAIFPLVVKNGESGTGNTGIVVKNPGSTPINVFIRINDRAGAPVTRTVNGKEEVVTVDTATTLARVETLLKTIAPGATTTIWTGNISTTLLNGWATVNSDATFQATAVRLPAGGVFPPVQAASSTASRSLFMPLVRKNDQLSSSVINLVNPTVTPADFTLNYYDSNGGLVLTETRKLGRFASTRFSLNNLGTTDPNLRFTGSAIISSSVTLAASVETPLEDGSVASYPALVSAADNTTPLAVYKEVDGVTTTLLVQNGAKEQISVKVEYLDQQDQVIASTTRTIPGFGRTTFWQGDLTDLKSGFAGRARLSTSGGTIAALALGVGPSLKGKALP